MLCSRCALPLLALYILLEQISAAVIQKQNKREVIWPDHDVFSHLSDPSDTGDLSVGDAGDIRRGVEDNSEATVLPGSTQNQNLPNRKANDKRRKVAPLDSIGRFQLPSSRKRKEKKNVYGEN